jgi:hypothetical protein
LENRESKMFRRNDVEEALLEYKEEATAWWMNCFLLLI